MSHDPGKSSSAVSCTSSSLLLIIAKVLKLIKWRIRADSKDYQKKADYILINPDIIFECKKINEL